MNDHRGIDWLLITILAFTAGVVNNILVPARRGAWGFLAAAIVGMFCGCTFGFASHLFEAPMGLTIMITSASGVLGDRVLMAILQSRLPQQNFHINGDGWNINTADGTQHNNHQTGDHAENRQAAEIQE
ncbi:hypothetical protein [Roseiconus lacunae]|uniref:Uncharacterized protein n=1 Tax=Roseiconus lacunae TaxID=2605694 RepID=A0ABT7PH36_9BACT|nr:hypothetical protein [Roseiconus lacunae]MDM4015822.1 hypothetical protein [Roseiconus lacunae]